MARQLSVAKKILFSSIVIFGFLFGVAIMFEIGLRSVYKKVENITGVLPWSTSEWGGIRYHWDEYHPLYGWTNAANYPGDDRLSVQITTNSARLRGDREYPYEKPKGVQRILFFGDSFTFGDEVNDHETFSVLLENMVPNSEVLNFGVHGTCPGQWMLRMEEEAFAYDPDLIVIVYPTLDYVRLQASRLSHEKPLFYEVAGELEIDNVPVPELSHEPWIFRHSFTAAWLLGRRVNVEWGNTFESQMRAFAVILERMQRRCDSEGVELLVVHLPDASVLEQLLANNQGSRNILSGVRKVLNEVDVDSLDLFDPLYFEYQKRRQDFLAPLGHWNGVANAYITQLIQRGIVERHPDWCGAAQSSPTDDISKPEHRESGE